MDSDTLRECTGFQWDEHNSTKIWDKHRVSMSESEQIFFDRPLVIADDVKHSQRESRFYALGRTDAGRRLFVVFTVRDHLIRVISARDMSRKERNAYQSYEEDTPIQE